MAMDQRTALANERMGRGDWARFWRDGRFDNMECLHARFRDHTYTPHTHDTYVVGVLVDGVEEFTCRGALHRATAGTVALVNPLEVHDGTPAGEGGYAYRMFYPSEGLMQSIAEDICDRAAGPPRFGPLLTPDPLSYAALLKAHSTLEQTQDPLAREAAMVQAMAVLITRHADAPHRAVSADLPARRLRGVLEMIEAHLDQPLDLACLAQQAGLGRFQLIRAFRQALGLTPAAYVTDRRVIRARRLLGQGLPPVEVAALVGLCDQSHLNRAFKARVGVTPGQYRAG